MNIPRSLTEAQAYILYEKYAKTHVGTRANPLRTYSGWLHENHIDLIDESAYVFPNNPVAKSSTSVMQAGVCQSCGCRRDGKKLNKKCECRCHV